MALKKCIKATSNLNQEDVAAVLENFDSYSGTMTQAEATALAVDDAIASVNQERSDTLAEIIRLNPSLVPTPVEPEAPIDQALIVSPLDPKSSQRAKARQLRKLGEENEKIITPILKEIDEIFGTESGISHKTLAKMVSKANRPSVKARKTWHDVEHVRDGFRFKTVLEDFSRLPEIIEHLAGNGIEIIKADTDKMLTPGSWGWRIASFDMRMPNGQIVEWYLPVQELEEAKKGLGHDLFEKWRDFDTEKLTPEQMDAFDVDVDASNDLYNDAWNTFLRRTGQRESELRASFSKASSLEVSLNRMKSLYSSVIENTESLNQTPPNLVPWNPLNKTTQSSPSRAKKTKGLRINSTSKNILSQVAAYLQPEQDHISVREGKKVANSEEAPGDFIQRSAQPETKPKTAVTTASLKNSIYKLQRIAPVTQKLDFMVYENQDEYFGPGSVERIGIIQGGFIVGTNEIVLFADNIPSKAVATALIRHEVVGHFGLRELLNRDGAYDKLLNRVYQARNADLKEEYNWVAKYYPKLIADKNVAGIADEMIARAAETKTQIGKLITKIYDQIIKLLNQFGLATADMTQKELKALIRVSESNLRRQLNTRENRMAETQVVSARMMEQTDTPQFLAWAGTDVVTPSFDLADFNFQGEGPFVMTAYHGTTHDIESFNSQVRGNTENHFGEMNYFTSDQGDADMNYAGEGPDLTARIEQRKEDIEREIEYNEQDPEIEEIAVRMMEEQEYVYDNAPAWEDMPDDIRNEAIDEYARKDLEGDSPQTLKVYLKTENPFVVNGDKTMNASPSRHYFEFYDQEAIEEAAVNNVAYDNDVEPADILADRETYEEAIQEASYEQMDNEPNKLVDAIEKYSRATEQQIYEAMSDAGLEFNEASHDQIENFLRNSDFLQDEVGDNGEYMSSDLTGKIIRELGFDSIIMKNAGVQFPNMGMGRDTVHIQIFDQNNTNIKSVDNTGTFDPNDSRIMFRQAAEEADAAPVGSSLGMPEENWREKFVRLFQDGFNRMLRAQEIITEGGGDATGDKNVYRAEELSHDQIGSRIRKFGKDYRDPLRKVMRPNSITLDELDAYLTAQHAPERNAWIASFNDEMPDGGSGMTNAEAAKIRSVLSQREGMDEAAAIVRSVNDLALDDMVEGGHITQEFADDLRARWTYYVPLKGIEGQEIRPGLGSGYSVVGSGIKKAMGRGAGNRAESPTAHSFAGAETTIVRTGKSKIGQALVNLIRANPDPELWTIGKRTAKRFRTIFGEAFDGYETAPEGMIENIDYHRVMGFTEEELMNADMEGRKPEKKAIWRIDQNYKHRDDVFGVMIAGEEILVNIKDPVLIEQLKKMNVTQMNLAVRTAGTVNRYLAMINTALNPEFVITNFERDFQTAMINLGGEHSPAIAAKVAKGLPGAIRGIWQATFDTKGDSEWRTLFNEMQEEGGTIGFFGLEDIETKVKKIRNGLIEKHGVLGKTMQGIEAVRDVVLDANLSVENAARLSAYKVMKEEALAKGVSMKEAKAMAASVAKNLTVNFNRKGELAPVLNSAFLFYNASIQGSFRIFTALKSPAVRKIVGGVMVAGFVNALFNRGVGGDDDDEIARWDKMSDFNKQTNIIFMHPDGSGEATKIKLPYGYNVFWYAGSAMADMMFGPKTVMNTAMNMAAAMLNAFNPINGSDFLDTITPTIVKPLAQHIRNENFMGAKVKPEYPFDNYTRPESQKFYPSTNKGLVELTTWLNEATGGDETHPGALDFSPETIKHYTGWLTGGAGLTATRTLGTALNLATGEPIEARNVPGLRTVTTKQSAYFDKERYYNAIREVNAVQAQLKIYRGTDEWGEYREEHSEVHALALHMKRYKNNVKRLRVLTDKAYADEDRETARELTEEIRQEMMEFSTMYDEAIADQGS